MSRNRRLILIEGLVSSGVNYIPIIYSLILLDTRDVGVSSIIVGGYLLTLSFARLPISTSILYSRNSAGLKFNLTQMFPILDRKSVV